MTFKFLVLPSNYKGVVQASFISLHRWKKNYHKFWMLINHKSQIYICLEFVLFFKYLKSKNIVHSMTFEILVLETTMGCFLKTLPFFSYFPYFQRTQPKNWNYLNDVVWRWFRFYSSFELLIILFEKLELKKFHWILWCGTLWNFEVYLYFYNEQCTKKKNH